MYLAVVTAALLGIFLGYCIGVWQQSRDEIIPDMPRDPDYEIIQEQRWEAVAPHCDLAFLRAARMIDNDCETIHNVPLSAILRPCDGADKKAAVHADRIYLDAIKVDRKSGELVRVILKPGQKAKAIGPILRKARIRTVIDADIPV